VGKVLKVSDLNPGQIKSKTEKFVLLLSWLEFIRARTKVAGGVLCLSAAWYFGKTRLEFGPVTVDLTNTVVHYQLKIAHKCC